MWEPTSQKGKCWIEEISIFSYYDWWIDNGKRKIYWYIVYGSIIPPLPLIQVFCIIHAYDNIAFFLSYIILWQKYWIFLYLSPDSYCSYNFALAKINSWSLWLYWFCTLHWLTASFLYCFLYSYCFSMPCNYCNSNSCCPLSLLKVIAKSIGKLTSFAFKSDKEQQISISR